VIGHLLKKYKRPIIKSPNPNSITMKYFIIIILIIRSLNLQAQSFDEDIMIHQEILGYIITNDGDTTIGKIKVQTRSKNQIKVKFVFENGRKKTFRPKNLIGYGYQTRVSCGNPRDPNYYRYRHFLRKTADDKPMPFSSKTVFMEVKESGRAILYSYYLQNNENVENKYIHYYYLQFQDGTRERKITQDDFDWAVPAFLEDCKEMTNLVNTRMGFANLEELVKIYNECQIQEGCHMMTEEEYMKRKNTN
jgi:hypothetical protein